jgi:hypothetical protein
MSPLPDMAVMISNLIAKLGALLSIHKRTKFYYRSRCNTIAIANFNSFSLKFTPNDGCFGQSVLVITVILDFQHNINQYISIG